MTKLRQSILCPAFLLVFKLPLLLLDQYIAQCKWAVQRKSELLDCYLWFRYCFTVRVPRKCRIQTIIQHVTAEITLTSLSAPTKRFLDLR